MAMDFSKIKMAVEKANANTGINVGNMPQAQTVDLSGVETVVSDDNTNATPEKNATDIDMLGAGILMLRDFIADMNMKIEYIMSKLGMTNEEISAFYEGDEGDMVEEETQVEVPVEAKVEKDMKE